MTEKVYVPCTISPGAFEGEHTFEVVSTEGGPFRGLAPAHYLRGPNFEPVGARLTGKQRGWVAARVLSRRGTRATVTVPLEGVVAVEASALQPRRETAPV